MDCYEKKGQMFQAETSWDWGLIGIERKDHIKKKKKYKSKYISDLLILTLRPAALQRAASSGPEPFWRTQCHAAPAKNQTHVTYITSQNNSSGSHMVCLSVCHMLRCDIPISS